MLMMVWKLLLDGLWILHVHAHELLLGKRLILYVDYVLVSKNHCFELSNRGSVSKTRELDKSGPVGRQVTKVWYLRPI